MINYIWCVFTNSQELNCNGTLYVKYQGPLDIHDPLFWIYLGIYVCLTLGAGLMSGLTLGMLSLDALTLEILMKAGMEPEAKYAKKLYPIIKRHHFLLVTLLLCNAACVESMPIFLDRISNPITAIIVSVTAVLIFGEVIPQAMCKRYGLAIGYYMHPIVYFLMGITIIISFPLSKFLDWIFGNECSSYYCRPKLKALIDLHGPSGVIVKSYDKLSGDCSKNVEKRNISQSCDEIDYRDNDHQLSIQEVNIIKGALDLTAMMARDAMVPLKHMFMLSDEAILDKHTIRQILLVSHSRIPVYSGSERRLIQGILLTKMLIQFNASQSVPISEVIRNNKCFQPLRYVTETTPLYDLLQLFKTGKTGHMAVVIRDDIEEEQLDALERFYTNGIDKQTSNLETIFPPVLGVITLEDVLEKLIQSEIIDEGDIFRNDICRRLIYKQKLKLAKQEVEKDHLDNKKKMTENEYLNEYFSKNSVPKSNDYWNDDNLLKSRSESSGYHTFMDA